MEGGESGQSSALPAPAAASNELRQQSLKKYFTARSAPFSIDPQNHRHRTLRFFCTDPFWITHPLFRISRTRGKAPTCNPISARACALLEKSIGAPVPFEKVESTSLPHKSKRANAVVVDLEDALVAVGGESGVLSVYDVDEAQLAMRRQQRNSGGSSDNATCDVDPVVTVEMGRSISAIAWHPLRRDELAVAFAFSSQVRIYDLSSVDSRAAPPKSVLEVSGLGKSCGHASLAFIAHPSTKALYLFACSTEGHLRGWNLAKSSLYSLCNFLVSPSRAGGISNALLGLVRCGENRITTVSGVAVFMTFDISRWGSPGFGSSSSAEPMLLKQFRPLETNEQLEAMREGCEGQAICASSTRIWVVDCKKRQTLYCMEVARPVLSSLPAVPSSAVASSHPRSEAQELSFVQLRDLLGQRAQSRYLDSTSHRIHAVAVWKQDASGPCVVSVRGSRWTVQPADQRPWRDPFSIGCLSEAPSGCGFAQPQITSGDFSYTLRDTVHQAVHGANELRISFPLPRSVSQSGPKCDLRLEWVDPAAPQSVQRCDTTVHLYQSDILHLSTPYLGPTVDNGSPRVWMRVMAKPSSSSSCSVGPSAPLLSSLPAPGADSTRRGSGAEIPSALGCVTALAAAPSLSLLIAGDAEERLWLLPFGGGGGRGVAAAGEEEEDACALEDQAARSKRQRQQ